MILLVDLCYQKDSLGKEEFVLPLARIVRDAGESWAILHYTAVTGRDLEEADRIILCGTALKDREFARHPSAFGWLGEIRRPVLGICAGMQTMVQAWGGHIVPGEEIGMTTIRVVGNDAFCEGRTEFPVFALHRCAPEVPDAFRIIARSASYPHLIRHRAVPQIGVLFHPEVRHEWVVHRFLEITEEGMD